MKLSSSTQAIYAQINPDTKLGDLRKLAKEIKKDHEMALELWFTNNFLARQLAVLIMDSKMLDQSKIDLLCEDIAQHPQDEKLHLIDWLLANQLAKDKKLLALIESWENSSYALQRRVFWYHQARLRWMGKTDQTNTLELLQKIEEKMMAEEPDVQWAMNFTAGQIGKWSAEHRDRCIKIGENTGLYKDDVVPRGCTPSYLPEFISIEVAKLNK